MAYLPLKIVPAGVAHARVLAELHQACFAKGWSEDAFTGLLGTPGAAAALVLPGGDPATPVGFVLYRCAAEECEIITLCVAPDDRRKGAARQLLEFLHAELSSTGVTEIFLEVEESNKPAIRLYEGSGYLQTGTRKNYYDTADGRRDALLFRCSLIASPNGQFT